jgi:hypothetical protein
MPSPVRDNGPVIGDDRPLSLTVVCAEVPYPDDHGGKVDVWRRIKGFKRLGLRVQVVTWGERPTDDVMRVINDAAEDVIVFPYQRSIASRMRALLSAPFRPPPVSSRQIRGGAYDELKSAVTRFGPDAIWLDGLYGCACAKRLATDLDIPLMYRSHNIEHLYWREQYAAARSLQRRLQIGSRLFALREIEFDTVRRAELMFDISGTDRDFWAAQGVEHAHWLPPLAAEDLDEKQAEIQWDVGFIGNLKMPSNVEGVLWVLNEVLPRLRAHGHNRRVVIAGSQPDPEIVDACDGLEDVDLLCDVPDAGAIRSQCRVLINPVIRGGGVSLRTVDLLASGKPAVVTTGALRGIAKEARSLAIVADAPDEFAAAIEYAVDGIGGIPAAGEGKRLFGLDGLARTVDLLQTHLKDREVRSSSSD